MCDNDEEILSGPYRATKLWNDIIHNFRGNVPLRRHRRQMRQFENCFAACEAVDCLHVYLCRNPNFGTNVSRNQTILLLRKLLQCHIFEAVHASRQLLPDEFKDNRDLYRFSRHSPTKLDHGSPVRSPFRSRTNVVAARSSAKRRSCISDSPTAKQLLDSFIKSHAEEDIPVCRLVTRTLAIPEIENTWKAIALGRLQSLLNLHTLENILDINSINPKFIIHNVNKVGPKGITLPINQAEELPHWLFNAMKCLAAWPKASGGGSCLPNYPGFEQDVFKVVRDYFENLDEPLTTFGLYTVLINILVMVENTAVVEPAEKDPSFMMTTSMEDLVSHMAKAWKTRPLLNSSLPVGDRASCPDLLKSRDQRKASTDFLTNACYETAFLTASPVTRMISPTGQYCIEGPVSTHPSTRCISVGNLGNVQSLPRDYAHFSISGAGKRTRKTKGANPKSSVLSCSQAQRKEELDSGACVNFAFNDSSSAEYFAEAESESSDEFNGDLKDDAWWMSRTQTEANVSSGTSFHTAPSFISRSASGGTNSSRTSASTLLTRGRIKSFSRLASASASFKEGSETAKEILGMQQSTRGLQMTAEDKALATEGLQFALLCLPPESRRKLHYLLRFMSKLASHEKLILDPNTSNRTLILDSFSRILVRARHEADYNEIIARDLATFLMDNYEAVFTVPETLKARVEERLAAMSKSKIEYGADDDSCSAMTYCEQVTREEYDRQSASLAERAMADLLNSIVTDPHLSSREKRKKLKQFKKMYPDIYSQKFPHTKKPTPLFAKSLQKLRGIRM